MGSARYGRGRMRASGRPALDPRLCAARLGGRQAWPPSSTGARPAPLAVVHPRTPAAAVRAHTGAGRTLHGDGAHPSPGARRPARDMRSDKGAAAGRHRPGTGAPPGVDQGVSPESRGLRRRASARSVRPRAGPVSPFEDLEGASLKAGHGRRRPHDSGGRRCGPGTGSASSSGSRPCERIGPPGQMSSFRSNGPVDLRRCRVGVIGAASFPKAGGRRGRRSANPCGDR